MYYNSPLAKPGEKPPTITSCADALATALLEVQMEKPVKIESPKIESPKPTTDMAKLMDAPYNIELQLQSQIREAVSVVYNKKHMGSCPDCGSSQLDHGSGCLSCRSCGFSMC
jgi:hypothetical protein